MASSENFLNVPIGNYDPPAYLLNLDKSINEVFMLIFERHGLELSEDEYQALWYLSHLQSQMKVWQKL